MRKLLVYITIMILSLFILTGCKNKILIDDGVYKVSRNIDESYVLNPYMEHSITFTEDGTEVVKTYEELDITVNLTPENKELFNNSFMLDLNKLEINYDTSNLASKLNSLNNNRIHSKKSEIIKNNDTFEITDIVIGNYLNLQSIEEYIVNNIGNDIVINLVDHYLIEEQVVDAETSLKNELDKIENTYITYTNGYKLQLNDLYDYLIVNDNKIELDTEREEEYIEYIDNLIEKELIEYDTYDNKRIFTKTNGEQIEISGGTWGDVYSSDLETEYVIEQFKQFNKEENRLPIYTRDMAEEIPNTYIEVSIDDQHVWYYENGQLVMESDCVTGTKGRNDTPHGVYFITQYMDGKYLTGATYRTWVNRWMRITDRGHGLHDATWRSSFGGNIYTYDGSHGCINLPKQFAYDLFDTVGSGTCVVIY